MIFDIFERSLLGILIQYAHDYFCTREASYSSIRYEKKIWVSVFKIGIRDVTLVFGQYGLQTGHAYLWVKISLFIFESCSYNLFRGNPSLGSRLSDLSRAISNISLVTGPRIHHKLENFSKQWFLTFLSDHCSGYWYNMHMIISVRERPHIVVSDMRKKCGSQSSRLGSET